MLRKQEEEVRNVLYDMVGKSRAIKRQAGREAAKINNDALAFAERNREIVELPEGLETNLTLKRKRGARTDDDVIEEAMEIHGQGITLMASLRYVGVPYTTWHRWHKRDHCHAKERYEFAHHCHMEAMSDKSLQLIEQLIAQRKGAKRKLRERLAQWHKAHQDFDDEHDKRSEKDAATRGPAPRYKGPPEPSYDGPEDWELAAAREQLKTWQLHMAAGIDRFKKKEQIDHNHTVNQSILHTIDVKNIKPEEALATYHKLIEGKLSK